MPAVHPIVTQLSTSPAHARQRVLQLYREWMRAAPEIVQLYNLDISSSLIRSRVRQEFVKNQQISQPAMIDRLIFYGRTEFEETMNQWKQKNHVMNYFEQPKPVKKDFLDEFFSQN